jgi:CheY-like chemotaxis protein/anti-sigma regulatory factor (Ser/Thr protein kinase)
LGDELRIKQIVNNLLSNAFKYTVQGTVSLSIVCTREGGNVWLSAAVKDSGIGLHPEDMGKLFSDYVRVDKEVNRFTEGTGLGLPLTKKMAEMMDGTIGVESEYGQGSIFTVVLRQGFVNDTVFGPEMVKNLKNYQSSIGSKYDRNSRVSRIKMPYAHVLVVDDNHTNLDVTQGMMRPYGMAIDCLTDGQQAVDAVREGKVKYDAIFMDHMMPGMDGIEATRIIRSMDSEYAQTVPIIALTANAVVGNEEMFLSNGFQAFLPKPMEVARLDEILRRWVRDKEQEKLLDGQSTGSMPEEGDRRRGDRRYVRDRRGAVTRRSGLDRRLLMKIAGLDVTRGVERLGGDWNDYREVLQSYLTYTPALLEKIKTVSKETLADYAITVHGIKGSSLGICAEELGQLAAFLEGAAKEGNFDVVSSHNSDFLKFAFKLLASIENLLAEMGTENNKPLKDKPDAETLAELLTACENYDMDGVDAAMAKINEYEYESEEGLVAWLRENVERMNFAQIKERLTKPQS